MENSIKKRPFKIGFDGAPETQLSLKVFVFDRQDKLLESQDVAQDGTFHLKSDEKTFQRAKIFIAPVTDAIALNPQPLPPQLEEIGAYRPVLQFDAKRILDRELLAIPETLWRRWIFCSCRVRGRVVKPFYFPWFTINSPVCHARVHICRLENWIFRLPDADIFKLRDDLIRYPIPPIPPIRPIPKPGPVEIGLLRSMTALTNMTAFSTPMAFETPEAVPELTLSPLFRNQLQTNSVGALRQILADNSYEFLYHPRFCWFYDCVEMRVVETDVDGRFDTRIWENCYNPNHNYYFWVEYLINGVWETVYRPTYCTGAFWNYACGSEVTISVNDPRVPLGCRPTVTGGAMEIVSIGNQGFVSSVQQPSATPAANDGLLNWNLGDGVTYRPFGGQLVIKANFSTDFPLTNATHYQISYRKHGDNDESHWKQLQNSVQRGYNETIVVSGVSISVPKTLELLDKDGIGFYKIPTELAQNEPMLNSNCIWASDVFDIGVLDTTQTALAIENTLYDIRVALYKKISPTQYQLANVAKTIYTMPVLNATRTEISSQPCTADYLTTVSAGGVTTPAFMMTIRIDNQKCTSRILAVTMDGKPAGDDCGFLSYIDLQNAAQLQFKAQHPNDFATYGFGVVRGNNNAMPMLSTNGAIDAAPLNGFTNTDGAMHDRTFTKVTNVAALLQALPTDCAGKAAFAQQLNVYATATDGTTRLWQFDAPEVLSAFAIVPA
jgi:hypothetical protein